MAKHEEQWLKFLEHEIGLALTTRAMYRRVLNAFEFERGEPFEAKRPDVRGWLIDRGGAPSTFSNRISALRSYFRFLVEIEERPDDPTLTIRSPRRPKRLPRPVRGLDEKLTILDDYDARHPLQISFVGQTRAMAVFLCETGLRIHEAVKCDWPVPCPSHAEVIGKGNKAATIPVTKKAREAWAALGGKWPIGARATQRRFERAGFSPHQCRHWRGTSMSEAGADVGDIKVMMRHENIQTTLGYAEWNLDRVERALSKVSGETNHLGWDV